MSRGEVIEVSWEEMPHGTYLVIHGKNGSIWMLREQAEQLLYRVASELGMKVVKPDDNAPR